MRCRIPVPTLVIRGLAPKITCMTEDHLHILVLAAGASSRMGPRDKLLEEVAGAPLLVRIVRLALETGVQTCVVLPPDRPLRKAALAGLPAYLVIAEKARDGMAESLKAGLAHVPEGADVLLLLADLPEIHGEDLAAMIAAHRANPGRILRATSEDGVAGHPVIFPARFRPALMALSGDQGARDILRAESAGTIAVPLPGQRAVTDLDTPEDWAAWRARNGR